MGLIELLRAYNIPLDYFTVAVIMWNFGNDKHTLEATFVAAAGLSHFSINFNGLCICQVSARLDNMDLICCVVSQWTSENPSGNSSRKKQADISSPYLFVCVHYSLVNYSGLVCYDFTNIEQTQSKVLLGFCILLCTWSMSKFTKIFSK
ncbi:uncharacterized protein LOC143231101 isoform X2 [Tachypleus tridentatus]|uniref:uncharacterized protein LOC143231101 isoform X2 n=1 Tax=Tachypleus tridentatus TaxID=6853 RepID=UPI003FD317F0